MEATMFEIHRRIAVRAGAVALLGAGIALSPRSGAGQTPSQEPVLAKNTSLRADASYGTDEKQRLDVYSPKGVKGAPVVVFVHGGEWTRGDKSAVSYKPKFFN